MQTPEAPATPPVAAAMVGVSGAAFTTYNPWVDGDFKEVCKNSIINCNIYGAKPDVWLNGGPSANGLGPDGQYFFAVLVPGGQPDPNDGGAKNLSDDYDTYTNRIFTVTDGEVSYYGGTHDLDSGGFLNPGRATCNSPRGCDPDGNPPLIRLYPYADTWNPGGVYILAICHIGDGSGYPVEPRDCKYDAFKVKEGKVTYEFTLSGIKFEDLDADGQPYETGEPKLAGWTITITGTGFDGQAINATVTTGADGSWTYNSPEYSFGPKDAVQNAVLEVCEVGKTGWVQSYPAGDCYDVNIPPAGAAVVANLDFGNFRPVKVTAKKFYDRDQDGEKDAGEAWIANFRFCLYEGGARVDENDFVEGLADVPCKATDSYGTVTWENLLPGTYTVKEEDQPYWIPTTATEATFTLYSGGSGFALFGNVAVCDGLTPGYWSNWRNHYTDAQFMMLLPGTIASSIAEADLIFTNQGCDGDDAYGCMRRFVLANQLTLNLTKSSLPNPDGAELYGACQLKDVDGNLSYWLGQAAAINPTDFDRDDVLYIKTVLDWFANMNFRPWPF